MASDATSSPSAPRGVRSWLRQGLVRFGFRFADDATERLFVKRFVLVHLRRSQRFLIAAGFLFFPFFLWDRAIDPGHWTRVFALREFGLAPLIFAAAVILPRGGMRARPELIISAALTIVLTGHSVICTLLTTGGFRYGITGMMLIHFGGVALFPLRLRFLIVPSIAMVVPFLSLEIWAHNSSPDILLANAMCLTASTVVALAAMAGRESAARREFLTDQALTEAHARVDNLLHSMMPREIVERIQAGEATIADLHGEVSILFADIVGFTAMSRQLSAPVLVGLLNQVFSRFDAAASRFGVEKIKTIGDAYMAVGGLSYGEDAGDHAGRMADFALAMRDIAGEIAAETELPISVRVGLHVGPVVAGVIGVNKPAFDCWGAAVNMASRLEQASAPGGVLISEPAYDCLREAFRIEAAPMVDLKGIGPSAVYRLYDRIEAPVAA